MKPILVVTHERSGTHLLINLINYKKNGQFKTIGYINRTKNKIFTTEEYKWQVYKDIIANSYDNSIIYKSHHQIDFFNDYLDFLFENYKIIYVKRNVKDVLISYYLFLFHNIINKPPFEEWIWSNPNEIGLKYLNINNEPDPHVINNPNNYVDRWLYHVYEWEKHKNNILIVNYEDILLNFIDTKNIIENYINKKIGNNIPDINDKNLPNFRPNKGIVDNYKNYMNTDTINKINEYCKFY